ncbi:hypothetical protein KRM28CT15_26560 [Krasilnikovia sp. M28-CT-15]
MVMLGPHAKAYANLVKAIRKLAELTQETGTQINAAQRDYARADAGAAARLDAGYPGAKDTAALRGTLAQGRPDLWPHHLGREPEPGGRRERRRPGARRSGMLCRKALGRASVHPAHGAAVGALQQVGAPAHRQERNEEQSEDR